MGAVSNSRDRLVRFTCGVCQVENYVPEEVKRSMPNGEIFFRCNMCGHENKQSILTYCCELSPDERSM